MTTVDELVIASVSNWGGYGLVAAMSRRAGRNLLPTVDEEREMVKTSADLGAVDSMSLKAEYRVDGFSLDENSETLVRLHDLLAAEGVPS